MTVGSCSQLSRLIYVWKSNLSCGDTLHILNVQVEEKKSYAVDEDSAQQQKLQHTTKRRQRVKKSLIQTACLPLY